MLRQCAIISILLATPHAWASDELCTQADAVRFQRIYEQQREAAQEGAVSQSELLSTHRTLLRAKVCAGLITKQVFCREIRSNLLQTKRLVDGIPVEGVQNRALGQYIEEVFKIASACPAADDR